MLMHVSKIEHGLCIRLWFGMHVSFSSSLVIPGRTLTWGVEGKQKIVKRCKERTMAEIEFTALHMVNSSQNHIPDHSNMHLQWVKQHVHYPAQKLATTENVPSDAFLHQCKIQIHPCTCYVPHICQESKQHYFVPPHTPSQPFLNTT